MATRIKFNKLFGESYIHPMTRPMDLATEIACMGPAIVACAVADTETLKDLECGVVKLEEEADAIRCEGRRLSARCAA